MKTPARHPRDMISYCAIIIIINKDLIPFYYHVWIVGGVCLGKYEVMRRPQIGFPLSDMIQRVIYDRIRYITEGRL